MEEDIFEKYERIARQIDSEFYNESLQTKYNELRRIRIRKFVNNIAVDFIAHDFKVTAAHRVGYTRPFCGVFAPIINKFRFMLM